MNGAEKRRGEMEMKMRPRQTGFTLIELLVVILVMAILAALLFQGIRAAMEMAKKTKAKTEVKGIAMALESYYNEYRVWPPAVLTTVADPELNPVLISGGVAGMLQGDSASIAYNKKSIAFMSFERFAGTNQPVNPWYQSGPFSTNNCYYYKVDKDFDNIIAVGATPPPTAALKRRVLVWTRNPNNGTFVTSAD